MISSITWIKRGACATQPRRSELTEEEFARVAEIAGVELEDAKRDLELAQSEGTEGCDIEEDGNWEDDGEDDDEECSDVSSDSDTAMNEDKMEVEGEGDELAAYNLEDYDNEPNSAVENVNIFSNIKSMTYHADGSEDPYLQLVDPAEDEDEQQDEADLLISPHDSMLIVASTADDISTLEFQVLEGEPSDNEDEEEDGRANLYTHHDVMLPTFPLAVEWFDHIPGAATEAFKPKQHVESAKGSFIAVAGFAPDVELWDVDVVDAMIPTAVLGASKEQKKLLRASGRPKVNDQFHVDSVLSLSWNAEHRNFLASGSADTTVKLWDLDTLKAVRSFVPHVAAKAVKGNKLPRAAKVCLTKWAPSAPTCLLTGGHDSTIRFFDTRAPEGAVRIPLTADPEDAAWNVRSDSQVYVSTEDGHVVLLDMRQPEAGPVWTLSAHQGGAASSISLTRTGQNLATVGADKTLKIWNVAAGKPSLSHSRALPQLGPLFACSWCPDQEGVIAVGGARGSLVLDLAGNAIIRANAPDNNKDDEASDEE